MKLILLGAFIAFVISGMEVFVALQIAHFLTKLFSKLYI